MNPAGPRIGLPEAPVADIVTRALAEDLPWGDATSDNLIPAGQPGIGRIEARQAGVGVCDLKQASLAISQGEPRAVDFRGPIQSR